MGAATWVPIRKVIAAIIVAVLTSAAFTAWAAGTGELGADDLVRIVLPALLTAGAAYFTAPDARQAEQAVEAGAVPADSDAAAAVREGIAPPA